MFATGTAHKRPFLHGLGRLRTFSPTSIFRHERARVADQGEADLHRLSSRTIDELGLLSGEGCITEWGLVERAARLQSGWY